MICSRCQAENPSGTRFCGQCGAPVAELCAACGALNPPENKFCGQCAAPLHDLAAPPARQTGEFKQVTVLFCDIVNSTGLAERVGPEALHELLRRFLDSAIAQVRRYDGTVPQFTGDGFMALFGAPVAHEDHARRALLAALAIRRAVGGEAAAGPDGAPIDVAIRIGVNTGLVVFGAVADNLRMDSTAVGDTANIAARLQEAAEPGTIVIGEATLELAGGYARTEPIGALALKGKSEPIPAYRLLEVASRRAAFDETAAFGARMFVGRGRELALLDELLTRAVAGHGQIAGILGEPGIGKSRLIAEFRRSLRGRAIDWVEGSCVSYGTAIPYLLALDLLRSACRIGDGDGPAAIADKVRGALRELAMDPEADGPLLLELLGIGAAGPAAAPSNPSAVKTKAFAIFRQLAINSSQRWPLVLAVDDLHWVDKVSEEFLGFLSEILPGARILLLAGYRPGYRPPWIDKSYAAQIPLHPLTREDSRQVLRSVLDRKRLPASLAETILAKAEGNAFFLEQLALHAGEESGVAAGQSIPATIRDVVTARIDRLPSQTKRLLQVAAVAGREFSLRLLREVWQGRAPLDAQLRDLSQLEFLHERVEADEPTYVFRHVLTQDAAYAGLLARDRRQSHAGVGRALETLYPGRTDEVAELLALHYGRNDDADKAVDYAILAAEKAQRRWANAEALAYFDDALRRLDTMPDTEPNRLRRIDAVIKQVEVKLALGRHAEHAGALAGIRGIVEASGDPRRRASWHYWMGFLGCLTGSHPAAAIEHCHEATAIAAAAGFDELDGHIQSCLAQAYIVAGELRAAIEAGERALSALMKRADLLAIIRTLWHLSSAANYLGEWHASLAYCHRALEHANTLNDLRLKGVTLWRTGSACIQQGDVQQGLRLCEEALALNSIPYDFAVARAVHGYGLIKGGQVDAGIAELSDVVTWFASAQLPYVLSLASLWLAEGHLTRDDRASARRLVEKVLKISRDNGYVHYAALAHRAMGECLAAEEPVAAEEHVESALSVCQRIGAQNDLAKALATRAGLRRAAGDSKAARQLLHQAQEIFEALGTRDETARVEAALADLDRSSRNLPVGSDHLLCPVAAEPAQHAET